MSRRGESGQITRALNVLGALRGFKHGRPIGDLAADVATSERTVRRDIAELQDAGFEIEIREHDRQTLVFLHDERNVSPEQRGSDQQLRDSEARKTAVLDAALDAIVSIDASGNVIELNAAAERMLQRPRAELVGASLAELLIPPGARAAHGAGLARYNVTRKSVILDRRIELTAMVSGREFPVEVSITRVGDSEPPTYTGFIRDISDSKRAQDELVRSNGRLRALAAVSVAFAKVATDHASLLNTIAGSVADVVGDGCLVTLLGSDGETLVGAASAHRNPALAEDYTRYLQGLAVTKTTSSTIAAMVVRTGEPRIAEVTPQEMVDRADDVLKPIVARLNVHAFAVVPIRARETVLGSLSLLRSRAGQCYTPDDVLLLQDLADRAGLALENARMYGQLEQRVRERTRELEAANSELESFSYSVAHDLRSPLRAIDGYAWALLEDYADRLDDEGRAFIEKIRAGSRRMAQLIDDLLSLSRVARSAIRRERVDLSALARSVVRGLHESEPDRVVEVAIAADLVVDADLRLTEIALTNLLGNAWKFTRRREGARIEISALPSDRPATFVIRDNGAGFDPAFSNRLFKAFQRLHAADFEGSGIGLATVQRVVSRHGGRIWAEGAVDVGASFFFTLEPDPPPV